jgi:hypothetical protein
MNELLRSALMVSILAFGPVVAATASYAQAQPETEQPQPAPAPTEGGSESSGG